MSVRYNTQMFHYYRVGNFRGYGNFAYIMPTKERGLFKGMNIPFFALIVQGS